LLAGVPMLSRLMPPPRRLTRAQCAVVWICVFALIVVLANRFPRIPVCQVTSWVPSAPSQITAKVLSKDLFVPPPACGAIKLLRSVPSPVELREERPIVSISLDNRLFTRPPPAV
jgi:hypothetical protein